MIEYQESLRFLYGLRLQGTKLGLNNIRRLLQLLDNPQRSLRVYHIGGTNGKGSVAALLQRLLRINYRRVGLFTSPHLEDFRERIRINDTLVPSEAVVYGLNRIRPLLGEVSRTPGCSHPTYFEVITALACLYFHESATEVAVLEVGLGGRLDATNVVEPHVSVITNISLDHCAYLGNNRESVAREKGGIIKNGVPVITAETKPEVLRIFKSICRRRHSRLIEVASVYRPEVEGIEEGQLLTVNSPRGTYQNVILPLRGEHQVTNCLTALAAWEEGEEVRLPAVLSRVQGAIRSVSWPGRFEIRRGPPHFIFDVAHNPAGARALARELKCFLQEHPLTLILGILADKDGPGICRHLIPLARRIITVEIDSVRKYPSFQLARICRSRAGGSGRSVWDLKTLEAALKYCYHAGFQDNWICVTGSHRLVGEARKLLNRQYQAGKNLSKVKNYDWAEANRNC